MNTDPDKRLQGLGHRIDQLRLKHAPTPPPIDVQPASQPLTHVFDDWNEDIRRRDLKSGRLSIPQRTAMVAIIVVFMLLLNWLWPVPK